MRSVRVIPGCIIATLMSDEPGSSALFLEAAQLTVNGCSFYQCAHSRAVLATAARAAKTAPSARAQVGPAAPARPKHRATSAAPVVWPINRAMAITPLAPPLRSGGALAIAVGDVTSMLQYSTYAVISPEGCASILWKSAERAADAAESLGITAERLKALKLIDHIVPEPPGGAHRDPVTMMGNLKKVLTSELARLSALSPEKRLSERRARLAGYGAFKVGN